MVFPPKMQRQTDRKVENIEPIRLKMAQQDLYGIGYAQRCEYEIVRRGGEHEYEPDRPVRSRVLLVRLVLLDADRPHQEEDVHPRAGGEEEKPPSELLDKGGC